MSYLTGAEKRLLFDALCREKEACENFDFAKEHYNLYEEEELVPILLK